MHLYRFVAHKRCHFAKFSLGNTGKFRDISISFVGIVERSQCGADCRLTQFDLGIHFGCAVLQTLKRPDEYAKLFALF